MGAMIRNLKTLGLTLVMVLMLIATGATTAQATPDELVVDSPNAVTITGEGLVLAEPHKDHTFTFSSGRKFTCSTLTFEGTVENGATEIDVTATVAECFANGTQPVTVTNNECTYRFHGGNEESSEAFDEGTVDYVCPFGKRTEIHVYSSHPNHTAGVVLCTYELHPFVNGVANTFQNTTTGVDEVDVTTTNSGKIVTRVMGSALVCGLETQTSVYTGSTRLRAYSNTAHTNQVDLRLEDPTP